MAQRYSGSTVGLLDHGILRRVQLALSARDHDRREPTADAPGRVDHAPRRQERRA